MGWFKRILGGEGNVKWKNKFIELEIFFNKISDVLEDFAATYNLLIEKYPHHGSSWTFRFKHPLEGSGQIEVEKTSDDSVLIRKSWSIDDYDTSTRFLKYITGESIGIDHSQLFKTLEDTLDDILQWKKDELAPHKGCTWSKYCSKEDFYKQEKKLPNLSEN